MKKLLFFCLSSAFALTLGAAPKSAKAPRWMDPSVNRVGTLPMHTSFFAFESDELSSSIPYSSGGCKYEIRGTP